jgi:hypothetical protein
MTTNACIDAYHSRLLATATMGLAASPLLQLQSAAHGSDEALPHWCDFRNSSDRSRFPSKFETRFT